MELTPRQKEIIDCLSIIKRICTTAENCNECVFYNASCEIQASPPEEWVINNEPTKWKALL